MNQETLKKVPRLFALSGELINRFNWFGYLIALTTIVISIIVVWREYKHISLTDSPGYFITISAWFWLSIGLVKFSKDYAQGISEGNRNAILSFILLLAVFCCLSGVTALYRYSVDSVVFGVSVSIFVLSLIFFILLSFGLAFYWNRLEGGISIYED